MYLGGVTRSLDSVIRVCANTSVMENGISSAESQVAALISCIEICHYSMSLVTNHQIHLQVV
jgi:hypothetical protein